MKTKKKSPTAQIRDLKAEIASLESQVKQRGDRVAELECQLKRQAASAKGEVDLYRKACAHDRTAMLEMEARIEGLTYGLRLANEKATQLRLQDDDVRWELSKSLGARANTVGPEAPTKEDLAAFCAAAVKRDKLALAS